GKCCCIFSEGGLHSCRLRLRLRQRHHQSDRKRAHSVLSQNLLHLELLYVAKRLVLLVTANAGLKSAFFDSAAPANRLPSSTPPGCAPPPPRFTRSWRCSCSLDNIPHSAKNQCLQEN